MSTAAGLPEATIHTMLRETLSAIPLDPDMNDEDKAMLKESVALTLATLAPRDPSQVMLAQRIVVAHHAAMECLRRAAQPDVSNAEMLKLHARHVAQSNLSARLQRVATKRSSSIWSKHGKMRLPRLINSQLLTLTSSARLLKARAARV